MKKDRILIILLIMNLVLSINCLILKGNPWYRNFRSDSFPIPSNFNNTVYFRSESILIVFNDTSAHLQANYTFKNQENTSLTLLIHLPFINQVYYVENYSYLPKDPVLKLNNIPITFTWNSVNLSDLDIIIYAKGGNVTGMEFNISFGPYEEKVLLVDYYTDITPLYPSYDDYIYYNYYYLIGTARVWNHTLDYAKFEFRIPNHLYSTVRRPNPTTNNFWYNNTKTHYIGILEFHDWLPESDVLWISWVNPLTKEDHYVNNDLYSLIISVFLLFMVPIGFLGAYKIAYRNKN